MREQPLPQQPHQALQRIGGSSKGLRHRALVPSVKVTYFSRLAQRVRSGLGCHLQPPRSRPTPDERPRRKLFKKGVSEEGEREEEKEEETCRPACRNQNKTQGQHKAGHSLGPARRSEGATAASGQLTLKEGGCLPRVAFKRSFRKESSSRTTDYPTCGPP